LILNGEMSEWSIEHAWKAWSSFTHHRPSDAPLPQPADHSFTLRGSGGRRENPDPL
jgi:hypothetical protein